MKKLNREVVIASKTRLVVFVMTVAMFILGAGAPEAGGGIINSVTMFFGW